MDSSTHPRDAAGAPPPRARAGSRARASEGERTRDVDETARTGGGIPDVNDLQERAGEVADRAARLVREYPGTSLLIAAALGYLVGRIVRA